MKPKRYGANSEAKGWKDLCHITGLGETAVKAAILTGELPGFKIGSRYSVPKAAYDAFCAGTWVPQFRPIFTEPIKAKPQMIHSMKKETAA